MCREVWSDGIAAALLCSVNVVSVKRKKSMIVRCCECQWVCRFACVSWVDTTDSVVACVHFCCVLVTLQHRHDRRLFIASYQEIVDKNPTESNYVLLGEAYMKVQMPTEATAVRVRACAALLASKNQ